MKERDSNKMTVQSVDRALSIIEILSEHPNGMGLLNISNGLHLPKSTTHRLLKSLISRDFVYQNEEDEKYYLSLKLAKVSANLIDNIDIRKSARPYLENLSSTINEVVHLCILDGHEVVYIDKVENSRTMRMYSQIGKRALLHCTGVGKMILSGLNEEQIDKIIHTVGLPKFTKNTLVTRENLFAELEAIQKQGYSLDKEEHETGIYCIAAPLYDYTEKMVAGISISGPINRVKENIDSGYYKGEILKTSRLISEVLGSSEHKS